MNLDKMWNIINIFQLPLDLDCKISKLHASIEFPLDVSNVAIKVHFITFTQRKAINHNKLRFQKCFWSSKYF